jgi:hypothetical protein
VPALQAEATQVHEATVTVEATCVAVVLAMKTCAQEAVVT